MPGRESLSTSLREIRRTLRGIVLMSTLPVAATATAVAVVGHALGLAWGPSRVRIDDVVLLRVQTRLDHEETRLLRHEPDE